MTEVLSAMGFIRFSSQQDVPFHGGRRLNAVIEKEGTAGLWMFQPPDFNIASLRIAHARLAKEEFKAHFGKKDMPIPLDAVAIIHGPFHSIGTGTRGLFESLLTMYFKLGPHVPKAFLAHVNACTSPASWVIESNFRDHDISFPHGGKAGHFYELGKFQAQAMTGFLPPIPNAQHAAEVMYAVDMLVVAWGIACLIKADPTVYHKYSHL